MKKKKFDLPVFIITTILVLLCIVTLYPILYVIAASFSNPDQFVATQGAFLIFPKGFSLISYQQILKMSSIWTGYRNTIFYVVLGTSINMVLTSLGAFVLSRNEVYLNKFLSMAIIFTMQFGGGLIPTYMLVTDLLGNSIWTLMIPGAIATTNLIILRTSFAAVPESLVEAAQIDGAGYFKIFYSVILPLSQASLAVIALYYGVAHWNSWFAASIYLRDRDLYPLQIFLREILIANQLDEALMGADVGVTTAIQETIKYSTIMVSIIPVLVIYPFLQKFFVKGVMIGAVKG
ncbi:MAG: carbohydrate ABC transporter permease [Lachnospiraceae bacterium]